MKPLKEIAFVVYPVREPKTAKRFYQDALGLTESSNWQDQWIEYDIGSGTLAITNGLPQAQPGAKGAVVGLEVADLDSFLAQLKAKSVTVVGEPWDTPVCRGAIIQDPDGNAIMLHQKK
jgi:predicted enzyme related to lactoylglutathione lyase